MTYSRRTMLATGGAFLIAAIAVFMAFHGAAPHHDFAATLFDPHAISVAATGLAGLRADRLALVNEMKAIIDVAEGADRDLTAEEQATFDEKKVAKETLDKRIARLQDHESTTAMLDQRVDANSRRETNVPRAGGPEASKEFENFGQFMHSVRFRPNDQRLNFVEAASEGDAGMRAEQRMDDGPSGGFMVPAQFSSNIMSIPAQAAVIRPRATVLAAGDPPDAAITIPALDQTGAAPGNIFGGVQVTWIGEGDDKPETGMKLREVTLTPHEVAGTIVVTDKLLRNWQAASSLLEMQLRGAVSQSEDLAFLKGNGMKKPLGILMSSATYRVNRKTANAVVYDDIAEMVARGPANGEFVMSRSAQKMLVTLKDAGGNPIWVPAMAGGIPATLFGRPASISDRNPQVGTYGDIWYGDVSQYLIKDGSGPFVAASEHVLFRQNKTVIKIFWNVDGAPWQTAPFQLENGYTVGSFVALDVPSA